MANTPLSGAPIQYVNTAGRQFIFSLDNFTQNSTGQVILSAALTAFPSISQADQNDLTAIVQQLIKDRLIVPVPAPGS